MSFDNISKMTKEMKRNLEDKIEYFGMTEEQINCRKEFKAMNKAVIENNSAKELLTALRSR